MREVFVIAEAGVNHNGDISRAIQMARVARDAGADAIKFQAFHSDMMTVEDAPKAAYQRAGTDAQEGQLAMLLRYEIDKGGFDEIFRACGDFGIGFMASPFDLASITMLELYSMPYWKIPSGEITNLPYLRAIARHHRRILLSTGMADLGEIEDALDALEAAGADRADITVLHCTTEYPAPVAEVNLRALVTLRNALQVDVGYSDHTEGIEVSLAAAALGACVIEKHFTLDRSLPGPDHKASLEPPQLAALVRGIRTVTKALGDGRKKPSSSELPNRAIVRKSIVASRRIMAGELFDKANITTKRPGTGLSPMLWDSVIGQPARREFRSDEKIEM